MSAPQRQLRADLLAGRSMRGLFTVTADATLCEFVATLGWDFLVLDAEHGPLDAQTMEHLARACEIGGLHAIARIPLDSAADVARFLDAGARGVMVPRVDSAEDARRAIELIKYPPLGRRGFGSPRSAGFGVGPAASTEQANEQTLLIVQIESRLGVEHAMQIAALAPVDVIFIGPADLSISLGVPFQWSHPVFVEAVRRIGAAAAQHGKVLGAYAGERDRLRGYGALGARFLATALEDVVASGSKFFLE